MKGHLNDEQWAAALLDGNGAEARQHLESCAACREELQDFSQLVGAVQNHTCKTGEQPEAFWRQQRAAINSRVARRDFAHPWRRLVWITATVMLVLLASTLLSRNAVPPAATSAQAVSDDALLLSVQQSIQSDLPQALRPAELLTEEMDRASASRRTP